MLVIIIGDTNDKIFRLPVILVSKESSYFSHKPLVNYTDGKDNILMILVKMWLVTFTAKKNQTNKQTKQTNKTKQNKTNKQTKKPYIAKYRLLQYVIPSRIQIDLTEIWNQDGYLNKNSILKSGLCTFKQDGHEHDEDGLYIRQLWCQSIITSIYDHPFNYTFFNFD